MAQITTENPAVSAVQKQTTTGGPSEVAALHEAEAAHGEHKQHPPEVPSILDFFASFRGAQEARYTVQVGDKAGKFSIADAIHAYQNQFFSLLIVAVVAIVLSRKMRSMSLRTPGRFQAAAEMVVEIFRDLVYGVLGEKNGRRYLPYIGSLFLFIFLNNILGIIPFMRSPSSVFQTTIALGLCTFFYVQSAAIWHNGPVRYVYHLMGEPQGEGVVMTVFMWAVSLVLLLPLHIISELIRPLSLALRLFGNILGEDILLGVFVAMGISMVGALGLPTWAPGLPLQLPFFFLALLTSLVQAVVFSLLSLIYFLMVLPHHEEAHEH